MCHMWRLISDICTYNILQWKYETHYSTAQPKIKNEILQTNTHILHYESLCSELRKQWCTNSQLDQPLHPPQKEFYVH